MSYPIFARYTSKEDYERAGVRWCEPMTAKEIESEEEQNSLLANKDYFIEEKFDGTRGLIHFFKVKEPFSKGKSFFENKLLIPNLLEGTGVSGGKKRVVEFFSQNGNTKDRADFLKKEYGTGGRTLELRCSSESHNSNGMTYSHTKKGSVTYTWLCVAGFIDDLIEKGVYYYQEAFSRCFSRRVSVKTNWFNENTDSLPHIRDLNVPELDGTIIDGEMFIPDRPFKDVSSTLNCKWNEAVKRQEELGKIVFHAFDILYYKGIKLENMSLNRRKVYLKRVIDAINSPYVKMVEYTSCDSKVSVMIDHVADISRSKDKYPTLYKEMQLLNKGNNPFISPVGISPRAYYDYVVFSGGEGVMLKPKKGKYFHKRGREFQKIKKFLTREVIIMGFMKPTKEYDGKFPHPSKWNYWEDCERDLHDTSTQEGLDYVMQNIDECMPVSKYYFKDWVGNIRYGVVITEEEISKLPRSKKFVIEEMILEKKLVKVIEVGDCSGFNEEQRERFTCNAIDFDGSLIKEEADLIEKHDLLWKEWEGEVIELKGNEIFRDTGKLRHPRFLRERPDKSPLKCTWKEHFND